MRNTRFLLALLGLLITAGCSQKVDDQPQPITASINNNAPEAKNAPAMETGESPGALAARMGGRGLRKGGKPGP